MGERKTDVLSEAIQEARARILPIQPKLGPLTDSKEIADVLDQHISVLNQLEQELIRKNKHD